MLRIIFKKRLDLIVAALLPVSILAIGFLISRAIAHVDQTFDPAACEASYGTWFGPETPYSPSYCPGSNISSTIETAYFGNIDPVTIHWHRDQYWGFAGTMSWGTNTCNVSKNAHIPADWFSDNATDYNVGYWNGTESKTRDGNLIRRTSDSMRWFRKCVPAGDPNCTNYRCAKYRLYITTADDSYYNCTDPDQSRDTLTIYDHADTINNKMLYPGDDLVSTPAQSGATYSCVVFQ